MESICFISDFTHKWSFIMHVCNVSIILFRPQYVNIMTLLWCHNGRDCISNHQPHYCLLNRLFRWRSKKTSKLRIIGLCDGNSAVTSEFPSQTGSDAENVSIWWRNHEWKSLPFQHKNNCTCVNHQIINCCTNKTLICPTVIWEW